MIKLITLAAVCWLVSACSPGNSQTSNPNSVSPNVNASATIVAGGNTVAYVLQFLADGETFLYIPSASRYALVSSVTGDYLSMAGMYYSSNNCSGAAIMADAWYGEVGKLVFYDGSNYYLASSLYSSGTSIPWGSAGSYGISGFNCFNTTGGTMTADGKTNVQLTTTTRPYDFASIAPLTFTYP